MARIARILSVVLLTLALLVGSASAECAWVLWRNDPRPIAGEPGFVTHHHQIVEAFTGIGRTMNSMLAQGACEERKKQMVLARPEKSGMQYHDQRTHCWSEDSGKRRPPGTRRASSRL